MSVYEIYVEKKPAFAQEAEAVAADLRLGLQTENITTIRIINRYFIEGISSEVFETAKLTIFSEPPVDIIYNELPQFKDERIFAVEYLPGQFDQRADSCAQCISLASGKERPLIRTAKIYAVSGNISDDEYKRLKSWLINPVESQEAALKKPQTLFEKYPIPNEITVLDGFITFTIDELDNARKNMNLAMDLSDIQFCQVYFRDEEKRNPTLTELRVLDTYWSDHCRHTTFLTELDEVEIDYELLRESYKKYLELRITLGRAEKPISLMDMAVIGAAALKKRGLLSDLDESDEINACSVKIKVDIDGQMNDWLLMFKNETHNHPTEIEPFGGAATCLGGAIRDPLSGRAWVYQAMRITGAADPLQSETLPGKLPQRKICRTAAAGYSSYGNQIGLATGLVHEIYHPGYAAKRMEIGAVIGAAPFENVIRKKPVPGDIVILLGGRTGRDGCGGATGSSKSHTSNSIESCGAEVQKGNAPEERKLQRLFRNPQAAQLIKKCNDFGAGGVSVSVGELADGLEIDLDKILKKYEGLDGTELAISESQERMSVAVEKENVDKFIALAKHENLEATVIARVTDNDRRLVMKWNGKTIVNICRKFLDTNGAKKHAKVHITSPQALKPEKRVFNNQDELEEFFSNLAICSQKGLISRFDSSVGAASAVSPLGGKYQLTPAQSMAAKIPVLHGETNTCSIMSWGFDPEISSASPYHGAIFAVIHSVAKIIAAGGSRRRCWLTFQEYFERLGNEPEKWGKPAAALLGALEAQLGLETAAIGGKDSMSGTFQYKTEPMSNLDSSVKTIDVPPTLVSFAVSTSNLDNIVTPEFKKAGDLVYHIKPHFSIYDNCNFVSLRNFFDNIEKLITEKKILSAWAIGPGGTAEAILKMCVGNQFGFASEKTLSTETGFGGFVVETDEPLKEGELLGQLIDEYTLKIPLSSGETADTGTLNGIKKSLNSKMQEIPMMKLQRAWENTLEPVYPYLIEQNSKTRFFSYDKGVMIKPKNRYAKPRFMIPVFPGTNSEYDTKRAIEKAGGEVKMFVIRNLKPEYITESAAEFEKAVRRSQGIVIPGGFSGGDEPDGSGKFITAFFRNPAVSAAITELLQIWDGLICGICNGFQALIKLGLVPYGEIRDMTETSPTLTFNKIGRHQSTLVNTRIISNKSPWLSHLELGESYLVPVSHGEGRFIAKEALIHELAANGQIATQYVDLNGSPSMDIRFNPNNSDFSIEGISSPDGRVFGRMAHNERYDEGLYKNIPGIRKMDIFAGAVKYFR